MKLGNQNIKAGAFVFAGLVVFIISIFVFGGEEKFLGSYYTLNAEFPNSQGLAPGSIVTLAGIPVGNISSIEIHPDRPTVVAKMRIETQYQKRISLDSTANVKTQGALGDKFIYIENGKEPDYLKDNAFITAIEPIDFLDLISQKTKDVGNIADLVQQVHALFKNLNEDNNSAKLMKNLALASGDFKILMADPNTRGALVQLNSILKKVDRGDGTLGRLVNDPTLYDKLLKILGESPRNQYFKYLMRDSVGNAK